MKNLTILTKHTLFKILSQRFTTEDKKLSQIPSPALLQDAPKAAKKIANMIKKNKKIALVGDYDVDGVTSSAIMIDFFRQIPYPIEAIIPNRFSDGYGISPSVLERIDADLIITVDNGISAIEAANICRKRGIELIITDHHTPSKILPEAYAIVNPKLSSCKYPFKEICGAQVAWLLLALLKKELKLSIDMKQFLDILAIAIIADIMPLIDINRTLVKEGLKVLMNSTRPSSIIIRDFINKSTLSSEDIAFQIAPRINAAGRLKDASIALDFFIASDNNKAYKQFELLNKLNDFRKDTEAQTTKDAIEYVNSKNHKKIIVACGEGWHEGVVGIVAARLVDKFALPSIVLSINNGIAKGSARSIGDVNIYELIKKNEHLLTKFGGHKMAAGLGLDVTNLEIFSDAMAKSALKIDEKDFIPKDNIMGILESASIDLELLNIFDKFEPFGEANSRPTFLIKDAQIVEVKTFGKEKNHSRIIVRQNKHDRKTLELILFKQVLEIPQNAKLTCSYSINKNEWNNQINIQLLINKLY